MQLIFQTGGALEADYPNYVERAADREANRDKVAKQNESVQASLG